MTARDAQPQKGELDGSRGDPELLELYRSHPSGREAEPSNGEATPAQCHSSAAWRAYAPAARYAPAPPSAVSMATAPKDAEAVPAGASGSAVEAQASQEPQGGADPREDPPSEIYPGQPRVPSTCASFRFHLPSDM